MKSVASVTEHSSDCQRICIVLEKREIEFLTTAFRVRTNHLLDFARRFVAGLRDDLIL
jgi:hypothetical protein